MQKDQIKEVLVGLKHRHIDNAMIHDLTCVTYFHMKIYGVKV